MREIMKLSRRKRWLLQRTYHWCNSTICSRHRKWIRVLLTQNTHTLKKKEERTVAAARRVDNDTTWFTERTERKTYK